MASCFCVTGLHSTFISFFWEEKVAFSTPWLSGKTMAVKRRGMGMGIGMGKANKNGDRRVFRIRWERQHHGPPICDALRPHDRPPQKHTLNHPLTESDEFASRKREFAQLDASFQIVQEPITYSMTIATWKNSTPSIVYWIAVPRNDSITVKTDGFVYRQPTMTLSDTTVCFTKNPPSPKQPVGKWRPGPHGQSPMMSEQRGTMVHPWHRDHKVLP